MLSVPIAVEEGVVGALALLNKPAGFTESDERLATLIAGQAGRSIKVRRNRDEAEQRERLAAIGQMLSGVVHDFRTPLTVISGYTELMATEPDEPQRLQYATVVDKQFEHLNAMMRETLAFARGERELLIRKVYLQKFASETEAYLRQEFKKSPVRLSVVPRYTGPARFDEGKLRRVVFNLARNAVEAMPTGGNFLFSIDREADDLVLRFEDDGPGLPPEIADRVFDPFATAGRPEGTGLGLSIVKQIADEHGGTVKRGERAGEGDPLRVQNPGRPRSLNAARASARRPACAPWVRPREVAHGASDSLELSPCLLRRSSPMDWTRTLRPDRFRLACAGATDGGTAGCRRGGSPSRTRTSATPRPTMRTRLHARVLAGEQGDGAAGQLEVAGEQLDNRLVRAAVHRGRADPDVQRSVADRSDAGARGAWPRPDGQLDGAGDLPDDVRYGVPAFLGARNDTLSSTRTGASPSGAVTASSNF